MVRGVLFAAGLGTRLGALTSRQPKALVEVQGRPVMYRVMDRMRAAGVDTFVVNVHAFASMVEEALDKYAAGHPQITVRISDERSLLLETGGGLKQMARWLSDGPFLVHNVDILSKLDLQSLMTRSDPGALATLAVRRSESDRYFLFNRAGILCGWENVRTGEKKISRPWEKELFRYGFMGIHYVSPEIFPLLTETGPFSITDAYLRLAATHDIRLSDQSSARWIDIGSPDQLQAAERLVLDESI